MKNSNPHPPGPEWSRIAEQARRAEAPEIDVRLQVMNRIREEGRLQPTEAPTRRRHWMAQALDSALTTPVVATLALSAAFIGFAGYQSIDLLDLAYTFTF